MAIDLFRIVITVVKIGLCFHGRVRPCNPVADQLTMPIQSFKYSFIVWKSTLEFLQSVKALILEKSIAQAL